MIPESQAALADHLEAAGLRVHIDATAAAPPCAVIEPGAPWASLATRGQGVIVAWRVTLVAGLVATPASLTVLASLGATALAALATMPALQVGDLEAPSRWDQGGATYQAAGLTVRHHVSL